MSESRDSKRLLLRTRMGGKPRGREWDFLEERRGREGVRVGLQILGARGK